ncbi:hypothetical protein B0H66DRAFT_644310 [Apodospora peruviana]|uniref:Uncharacterized protein n=1 Tax=Apodospora peruviana TaxID=516989 RepID=A0AAE0LZ92_9PEZI|nr:hypothetical protein B0H66DRAFT_644310 [Apodospora peruviana]
MPHNPPDPKALRAEDGKLRQWIYRYNCTTCQKAAIMHIRLVSPPDDFLLVSLLDPLESLGDYQCFEKNIHLLFCKTCGAGAITTERRTSFTCSGSISPFVHVENSP